MNNNKLTLVVDGNWLLMSRFFMKRESFRSDLDETILESSSVQLADLMAQSISVLLRQFGEAITNMVFVSDNRSWRKELPLPSCIPAADYKGTREQDSTIKWEYVYKSISVLRDRLDKIGVTTSNNYGVEGDDWCWWWSRRLNAEGINVLLWTSDEDVKQLIQVDEETGAFTAWYEKNKGVVLNACMQEDSDSPKDDLDFFMTPIQPVNPVVESLRKVAKITYINPSNIINKKIYIGDAGDNILPIFTYNKGSKTYKATQKDWQKVIDFDNDAYKKEDWLNDLPSLYSNIYEIKSPSTGKDITKKDDFIEHAKYNRKMVWLDESQIPENIQSQMATVEYKEVGDQLMYDMKFNWKTMSGEDQSSIQNLFENDVF